MAKERSVIKTGKKGTQYQWLFELDEERGHLRLVDVKVHGESIIEVVDLDLQQKAYNEQFDKWINIEA